MGIQSLRTAVRQILEEDENRKLKENEKLEKATALIREANELMEMILQLHFDFKRSIEDRLNEAAELMKGD